MPALELAYWAEFERDFGPLTVQARLDHLVGLLSYTVHASAGGKEPPEKFMPRWQRPVPWTDDQLWAWLDAEAKKDG